MTGPEIKGWCPGALRPMLSGDGWVVRVRPRAGRLTQPQAAGIAALARRHGNGVIDLTARANVQLRGVTEASHTPLVHGLRDLGLIDASAEAEARRNILVSPFWAPDDGTQAVEATLAEALTAPDGPALPGKFGFLIDPARQSALGGVSADIRIMWHRSGWLVCGDSFDVGAVVPSPAEAAGAAIALAKWFVAAGGGQRGLRRMADLWPQMAPRDRNARLPHRFQAVAVAAAGVPEIRIGACPLGCLVGFAFGQTDADTLAQLATFGPLRITPWRSVLIEGLSAAPDLPGLIISPQDPLLRVIACTGAPGCAQALAPTRPLARALASHVPAGVVLHVAGCAKGCAHPGPALTLTAAPQGFGLIRHGPASAPPDHPALPPDALPALLRKISDAASL
jgi:precorrin-3B synthase